MDRQQLKFISVLLALLVLISPLSGLAMQPAMSDSQPDHCQDLGADSRSSQLELSDHASCAMDNCAESCNASHLCSSQAPIILTLLDSQNHPIGRGIAIDPIPDKHLSISLSGLYRPPRV